MAQVRILGTPWGHLSSSRIHALILAPVRIIHMLVHQVAFLLVQSGVVGFGQGFEDALNGHLDARPGGLMFAPVQHQELGFEGVQQFLGHLSHTGALGPAELGIGPRQDIKDGQLFFG